MLSETEINDIEERCSRATPGPWKCDHRSGCIAIYVGEHRNCLSGIDRDKDCIHYNGSGIYNESSGCWEMQQQARDNAEFIAASRTDVVALVAEVRRLNAENFQLASWQCVRLDGSGLTGDDHGHQYCQLDKEVRRLREERDAISELADAFGTMCGGCFGGSISYRAQDRINAARKKLADAKAALEAREGT